jgi:hypothetical protein
MYSRKIENCIPALQIIWPKFRDTVKMELGLDIILTCTSREYLEQYALYLQGRENLEVVNHARDNAQLPRIDNSHNNVVTWTLNSKHVVGSKRSQAEAFDIVIVRDKKAIWDVKADINGDHITDYCQIATIGRRYGLKAGADFVDKISGKPKPDYPHYEL